MKTIVVTIMIFAMALRVVHLLNGKVYDRWGNVIATKKEQPRLFWLFVVMYALFITFFVVHFSGLLS